MTEEQKRKRKFRGSKKWKLKKLAERKRAGGKDEITLKPLRKGWQLHHNCLDEKQYENMSRSFLCCNKKTHEFTHWLYIYYKEDESIIDRIKAEMEAMKNENEQKVKQQAERKHG